MPSIALIHSGKSFMPEIGAYQDYFREIGITVNTLIHPSQSALEAYDILWFFMGIQMPLNGVNRKKMIIHEYCSASTPPFARLKDSIKKIINPKPALRITLTPEHRGTVFSSDHIPLIIRKQGVHQCFFERMDYVKEYDYIYTGSASRIRNTHRWLRALTLKFPDARIKLVGNHEPRLVEQFRSDPNIHFHPSVPITSLPALLASARYAINYVPDIYPFNIQPSTKLLEYAAAGCKIISNRYLWINQFSLQMNAGIFFVDDVFSNLGVEKLEQFYFTDPDMDSYRWECIFKEMQLLEHLSL